MKLKIVCDFHLWPASGVLYFIFLLCLYLLKSQSFPGLVFFVECYFDSETENMNLIFFVSVPLDIKYVDSFSPPMGKRDKQLAIASGAWLVLAVWLFLGASFKVFEVYRPSVRFP